MVCRARFLSAVAVLLAVGMCLSAAAQPIAEARLQGQADEVFKTGNRYPDIKLDMDAGLRDTIKRLRRESIERRFRLRASMETALDSNPPAGFNSNAVSIASEADARNLFGQLQTEALDYRQKLSGGASTGPGSAALMIRPPYDDWGMATTTDKGALVAGIADPLAGSLIAMCASSSTGRHLLAECIVWIEKAFLAPAGGTMTISLGAGGHALASHAALGSQAADADHARDYQATRHRADWLFACHPTSATWREQMRPAIGRGKLMLPPIKVEQGDPVLVGIGVETYVCTRYGAVATALRGTAVAPLSVEIR